MALTGCSAYGENLNSCSGQSTNIIYYSVKKHTAQRSRGCPGHGGWCGRHQCWGDSRAGVSCLSQRRPELCWCTSEAPQAPQAEMSPGAVRPQAGISPVCRAHDLLCSDCPHCQDQQHCPGQSWGLVPGLGQLSSRAELRGVSTSPALQWASSSF